VCFKCNGKARCRALSRKSPAVERCALCRQQALRPTNPLQTRLMRAKFHDLVQGLDGKLRTLLATTPVRYATLPREMPEQGIYLFSEGERHLYVGRTNRIRRRLAGHCR
jgi:hypothetical protein